MPPSAPQANNSGFMMGFSLHPHRQRSSAFPPTSPSNSVAPVFSSIQNSLPTTSSPLTTNMAAMSLAAPALSSMSSPSGLPSPFSAKSGSSNSSSFANLHPIGTSSPLTGSPSIHPRTLSPNIPTTTSTTTEPFRSSRLFTTPLRAHRPIYQSQQLQIPMAQPQPMLAGLTAATEAWAEAAHRKDLVPRSLEHMKHSDLLAISMAEMAMGETAGVSRQDDQATSRDASPESSGWESYYQLSSGSADTSGLSAFSNLSLSGGSSAHAARPPMGPFAHATPPSISPTDFPHLYHGMKPYHPIIDSPLYDASAMNSSLPSSSPPLNFHLPPAPPLRQNVHNQPQPLSPPTGPSKPRAMAGSWRSIPSITTTTAPTIFRPMHAVTDGQHSRPPSIPIFSRSGSPTSSHGSFPGPRMSENAMANMQFSANYRGERTVRNCSAPIDDSQNCSLWITNLPPDVSTNELLGAIHGIGRVYACVINPPNAASGHVTSAAKVVFFERDAAQAFFVCANAVGFSVRGFTARVSWNRIKSCEVADSRNKSRVIVLTGFSTIVAPNFILHWFSERFKFEMDNVKVLIDTGVWAKIEYRFGSYRCQAEAAKMAIARELHEHIWEVKFGTDPCSVGEFAPMTAPSGTVLGEQE